MSERRVSTGHGPGTIYWRGLKDSCKHYEFDKIKPWLMPPLDRPLVVRP